MDWGSRITYLASTAFKERVVPFGIKDADRLMHLAVLGKLGSGRSPLLTRMALQDVERGMGLLVLDANGNLGPMIMERLNAEALARLVHVDASDAEYPFSIDFVGEFRKTPAGKEFFYEALASVYGVERNPLSDFFAEYVLKEAGRSVLDPFTLLSDEKERTAVFPAESEEAKKLAELFAAHPDETSAMTENGRFLMKDTMVRNVVGQREGKFSLSSLKEGSIIIVDLSRVRIFPTRIGPLVKLFMYALRAQGEAGNPAALYLHDCLRYFTLKDAEGMMADHSFALTLTDTVYRETDLPLREKVLSRCGSLISFEPHQTDIPLVEKLFYPYVSTEDLQALEPGESCVHLTIDSVRAKPFFAHELALPERLNVSLQDILVDARKKYTTARTQVDQSFKKQNDKDKKGGQPPFQDAFKNIFAKRDPAKALAMGEKKPNPAKPEAETGLKQAVAQVMAPQVAATAAQVEVAKAAAAPVPVALPEAAREIPEDVLRSLLYAGPLPA